MTNDRRATPYHGRKLELPTRQFDSNHSANYSNFYSKPVERTQGIVPSPLGIAFGYVVISTLGGKN